MKNEKKQYLLLGIEYSQDELEQYAINNGLSLEQSGNNQKLIIKEIINPENNQKLINSIIDEYDEDYYNSQFSLCFSSSYHDYSNTTAGKILKKITDNSNIKINDITIDDVNEYNGKIDKFNKYGYAINELDKLDITMDNGQIEKTILDNVIMINF